MDPYEHHRYHHHHQEELQRYQDPPPEQHYHYQQQEQEQDRYQDYSPRQYQDHQHPQEQPRYQDPSPRQYQYQEQPRYHDPSPRQYQYQEQQTPQDRSPRLYHHQQQQQQEQQRYQDPPPLSTYRGEVTRRYQWRYGPGDGVYMFVRFAANNGTSVEVAKHAVVLSTRTIYNMGGRFVGISTEVECDDTTSPLRPTQESIMVFWFYSIKDAKLFIQSDPKMKQQDFPSPAGFCDVWSVVRFYTPPNELEYNTFMLSEVRLRRNSDYMEYKERFARQFAKLLVDYGAQPFVTQSMGAEFIRRFCCPSDTIITVHLFKDQIHLETIRRTPTWDYLMGVKRGMAEFHNYYFTVDPKACP